MYRIHKRDKTKRQRLRFWLILIICLIIIIILSVLIIRAKLRPKLVIKQANVVTSHVSYDNQTKHYDEPDFGIDMPATWTAVARPPGTYQSYTWQSSDQVTDGQQIEIFEDTIPVNFAVNRALIVEGGVDRLNINGVASDNCSTFTKGIIGKPGQVGVPAKYQNVDFLCDQSNQTRDTIGTNSTDGVNTVILLDQNTGLKHKFLFTYTDHQTNPDYTIFYNALNSFRMQ